MSLKFILSTPRNNNNIPHTSRLTRQHLTSLMLPVQCRLKSKYKHFLPPGISPSVGACCETNKDLTEAHWDLVMKAHSFLGQVGFKI